MHGFQLPSNHPLRQSGGLQSGEAMNEILKGGQLKTHLLHSGPSYANYTASTAGPQRKNVPKEAAKNSSSTHVVIWLSH